MWSWAAICRTLSRSSRYNASAATAVASACGDEPGLGVLTDQVPFKLRQRAEHVEDQFAAAGGRVDVLLETFEPHAPLGQGRDDLDQMPQRPPQAVELPNDEHVAGPQLAEQVLCKTGRSTVAPLRTSS